MLKILPNNFIPSKKGRPTTELQTKEVKIRFGNLHYRSIIGALLYVSCCTRPDVTFAVNKLTKYYYSPGVVHYRAMLHLIGFLKGTLNRSLKFYSNLKDSPTYYKVLLENNITINENTITTFSNSSWNQLLMYFKKRLIIPKPEQCQTADFLLLDSFQTKQFILDHIG